MYIFSKQTYRSGLVVLGLSVALSANAMATKGIVNLKDCSLSAAEAANLQELLTEWEKYYKGHDYVETMKNTTPFKDACGNIHELKDVSICTPTYKTTGCIADMRHVKDLVGATGPHFHRNTAEAYIVLQGTGTVVIGSKEYPVKPGEKLYIPTNHGHFTAPERDLILGVVNIPYFDKDDFILLEETDDATRKEVKYDHEQYLKFARK